MFIQLKKRFFCPPSRFPLLDRINQTPLLSNRENVSNCEFVAIDLEMTGLDVNQAHIIAIGWVKISKQIIHLNSARRLLINSEQSLKETAPIHGIRRIDLASSISIKMAMESFLENVFGELERPPVLIYHSARIDHRFISKACKQLFGAPLLCGFIDTQKIEQQRPQNENLTARDAFRLGESRKRYHLPHLSAHDALTDALATAELFLAQSRNIGAIESLKLKDIGYSALY